MDALQWYACAVGSLAFIAICAGFVDALRILNFIQALFARHCLYPYVLSRHRWIGPWTRAALMRKSIYIAGNTVALLLVSDVRKSLAHNAGVLALVNMVPLFLSLHHSAGADLLHLTLSTYRALHGEVALVTTCLIVLHVSVSLKHEAPLSRTDLGHIDRIIVGTTR